jgi:glycerophosphoryl diester phosphodiesterase
VKIPAGIKDPYLIAMEAVFARWPQARPPADLLANCRLIGHRGERDGGRLVENSLAAFDRALTAGLWGIELDVRWTRDTQPVVLHDEDARRVFGKPMAVAAVSLARLRRSLPQVPTLEEVVDRYGGRLHLMAEVKGEAWDGCRRRSETLGAAFGSLEPGRDYHLLSFYPDLLDRIASVPPEAMLPIPTLNGRALLRRALNRGYAGIAGHYTVVTGHAIRRLKAAGKAAGTGMVNSRRCLYREVNRGVDWIFSDRAGEMQAMAAGSLS